MTALSASDCDEETFFPTFFAEGFFAEGFAEGFDEEAFADVTDVTVVFLFTHITLAGNRGAAYLLAAA